MGNFEGNLWSVFFLLKICPLLASAVASKAVDVHVAGFQLLHQLCDKDGRPDVIKGDDEDVSTIGNAS